MALDVEVASACSMDEGVLMVMIPVAVALLSIGLPESLMVYFALPSLVGVPCRVMVWLSLSIMCFSP